jgi:hypothetical protein
MFKALLFASLVFAAKEQHAHVHGHASVSMAFEGKQGKISVNVPTEAIYGFEYAAKSAKDKKAKQAGLDKLEQKISEMIVMDPSLKCEIKKDIFEIDQKDHHADIDADFNVNCNKSPADSVITFNFQKVFSHLKHVDVSIVLGDIQKSEKVEKDGVSVELK